MDRLSDVSVATSLPALDAQLTQLELDLVAAQERLAARRQELAEIDLRPALLVEVEASVRRFDAMEREFDARRAAIDDATRLEVERILLDASTPLKERSDV